MVSFGSDKSRILHLVLHAAIIQIPAHRQCLEPDFTLVVIIYAHHCQVQNKIKGGLKRGGTVNLNSGIKIQPRPVFFPLKTKMLSEFSLEVVSIKISRGKDVIG